VSRDRSRQQVRQRREQHARQDRDAAADVDGVVAAGRPLGEPQRHQAERDERDRGEEEVDVADDLLAGRQVRDGRLGRAERHAYRAEARDVGDPPVDVVISVVGGQENAERA
jgi:hypothetical protein